MVITQSAWGRRGDIAQGEMSMTGKFLLLTIFAIAMAYVEGVVVVYLRKVMGISNVESNLKVAVNNFNFTRKYLFIEKTREVATIVMLIVLAFLTGSGWGDKIIVFLWTFAFWDIFYYFSLYILIKWPPRLTTIDVLFLIPRPWIAPVWVPILISSIVIISIICVSFIF